MNKEHVTINFKYKGKPLRFDVLHNLSEYGESIESAFINWSERLSGKPSLIDFCRYVESKNPLFRCTPRFRKEVTV